MRGEGAYRGRTGLAHVWLWLALCLLSGVQVANAAEAEFKAIHWEDLLAEAYGGATATFAPANEAELAAYLQEREKAPANPHLDGQRVRLAGFVVPLERDADTALREFLLVPFFGACIHVPPPPQNQIVHVFLDIPVKGVQSMDRVAVAGTLALRKSASAMGEAAYTMQVVDLRKDSPLSVWQISQAVGLTLLCGLAVCPGWVGPLAGLRLHPALAGPGVAFAAGIMACLGVLAVGMEISLLHVGLFALGAAFVGFVHWLTHYRQGGRKGACHAPSGMGAALAIAMHNIPECFMVLSTSLMDTRLGLVLAGAMVAHNLPLGMSIGLVTGAAGLPRPRAYCCALLAGVVPPLVAILGFFWLRSLFSQEIIRAIFACAGGGLVCMALFELFPFACSFGKRPVVFAAFATGAALVYALLMLMYSMS